MLALHGTERLTSGCNESPFCSDNDLQCAMLQMGGPEGVRANEITSITLSCAKGMKVHAVARVKA